MFGIGLGERYDARLTFTLVYSFHSVQQAEITISSTGSYFLHKSVVKTKKLEKVMECAHVRQRRPYLFAETF